MKDGVSQDLLLSTPHDNAPADAVIFLPFTVADESFGGRSRFGGRRFGRRSSVHIMATTPRG